MTEAEFERALASCAARLQNYARSLVGDNEEDAQDVFQDACLRAFRYRHTFRAKSLFITWMSRIVYRVFADRREANRKRAGDTPLPETLVLPAPREQEPQQIYEQKEQRQRLYHLIYSLPATLRPVCVAYLLDGATYEEIAVQCGMTVRTARDQMSQARRLLRAQEWTE